VVLTLALPFRSHPTSAVSNADAIVQLVPSRTVMYFLSCMFVLVRLGT